MRKEKQHNWGRKALLLLGALVLAVVLELCLFNRNALLTIGKTWTPLPEPKTSGNFEEDARIGLFFNDLDCEVSWCHIEIEVRNADGEVLPTDFYLGLTDDGNTKIYRAGEILYYPGHDKAAWFPLHPYGTVHRLTVDLFGDKPGGSWKLLAAEINGNVPFRISLPRIAGFFALFVVLWLLRPGSGLWDNRLWNRRPWAKVLCTLLILLLNMAALGRLMQLDRLFADLPEENITQHQYTRLARSLAEGRTWIDGEEEQEALELLKQMENPYDRTARKALFGDSEVSYSWDTAYYNGHYYVYFGVVPVLLFYLPYYLLTGADLPTVYASAITESLVILGAFLFLRALIRRYFPRTPFPVYLLLSLLLGNCSGPLFYALEPSFYVLPLIVSLALVLFGMTLWLSAAERWALALGEADPEPGGESRCFAPLRSPGRRCSVALRIAAGGLLCAMVAGSRPQFLVFSALALPIFWPLVLREPRRAVSARRILVFGLAYAAVAAPLMYYNYIRFGSPFDFGANYNLTTNDMTRRGFSLARLPDGLFAYLFRLPNVELSYPYIKAAATTPLYMGKTIKESMFGGAFLVFPFLWSLLGLRRANPLLRARKLRGLVWLPLILALIVVIADTEMAGILWRYMGDFLALLFLAAIVVFLALLQTANPRRRRFLQRFLTVTVLLGLAACLLISVSYSSLLVRDWENYYRLKDLLSIA